MNWLQQTITVPHPTEQRMIEITRTVHNVDTSKGRALAKGWIKFEGHRWVVARKNLGWEIKQRVSKV